jgi:predicted dithiol-disulfide oxidoreductase (DUF899 family)
MPDYKIGTREEWRAARDELAKLEAEHAKLGRRVTEQRRQLPWVPVEKEYQFDTEEGKKTLAALFDGRSQLLAYNIMFGPDYELGACPGCSNLGDELDATRVHLNHRDVTLICFSRAPIDRLIAYKQRMGWQFPYVSTYGTEFPFDFGIALTPEQARETPEVKEMIDNPPGWLADWGRQVGAKLADGLREGPSFVAFARENGSVYHTYTVMAPDRFVAPYHSFLLERTPKAEPEELRAWRKTFAEGAERNRALGVWGAVAGAGGAAGVLLGGVLTSGLSWRWVLFVNVPIGLLCTFLAPRVLVESHAEAETRSFDVPGAVTVTAGLALLVYALVDAVNVGWGSTATIAKIAGALALLASSTPLGRSAVRWASRSSRPWPTAAPGNCCTRGGTTSRSP